MTGIILTLGSAGFMCVAGVGISSALKWFHSYEPDFTKKPKRNLLSEDSHDEHINTLKRRIRNTK